MKGSNVLLVDTNRGSVPIYKYLESLGCNITVVGSNPNEPLAKISKNYLKLDYSDFPKMEDHLDNNLYDFLIPGCTDLSYKICSLLNKGQFAGLDTFQNTETINSKDKFRSLCVRLNIPIPKVLSIEESKNYESVIVKPIDSFSGRGITILKNSSRKKIEKALFDAKEVSISQEALIEEYVEGQLYSYSAFIEDKDIVASFCVQEDSVQDQFAVDTSKVVNNLSSTIIKELDRILIDIYDDLNLVNGLIHTQLIVKDNQFWIIEMTRRCPGDLYPLLIEYSTDYDYAASYVAPFIGKRINPFMNDKIDHKLIRHTISSKSKDNFWGMQFKSPLNIKLFVPLITSGEKLASNLSGRIGICFIECSSQEEQDITYQKIINRDLYKVSYERQ